MATRVFEGSSGIVAAVVPAILVSIGTLAGGLYLMQSLRLAPVAFVGVLLGAVGLSVFVLKAIGTDATFALEADALVRTKRRSVRRVPFAQVLEVHFRAGSELERTPSITLLTRSGETIMIWGRTEDQSAELESFCEDLRRRLAA